ncbi:hypothetical protein [Streptomyces halobius]|uniref:Uncharacterized protein n=1 Tax=Streptomyces halobius TaxID=2879846 RepID=A0ABY4M3Y3_9ACTN|nr:hypothetical protein [Streptomyces halobius]UQA92481.1 hypothetical protein K9S39_12115 [Streptomyces halobius]
MRRALREYAFNKLRRDKAPSELRTILSWIGRNSLPIVAWGDTKHVNAAMRALDTLPDGSPTAASSVKSAIFRLTVDHIEETDGVVRLRLGDVPVDLPGPVAELALQQVAVRRSHAALARTDSPWLFPGGQLGRPISVWAMGERLRKLGIRLAETRSTALFQLATELPAAVFARTLGIGITVAVKWQRAVAGDWGTYAAEVSRRNSS